MDSISKPLFYLIAFSFENSIFPDKLKLAKIHSVFKNSDCSSVCNYRPISLLPVFSKIFERRLCLTEHAIFELSNKISMFFNKGEQVLGVFIDLSKAFHTVDHGILLSKVFLILSFQQSKKINHVLEADRSCKINRSGFESQCSDRKIISKELIKVEI
ncbi:uncharacterized protein LOC136073882 [Hydra vulgaris]|uniref:uncharacterized protein LOC136073882 n=1 Tax=Hydra vulgaris TaxID=6087 RepID=UPI0032EA4423